MAEEKKHHEKHHKVHKKSFTDVQALNLPKEGMLTFTSEGQEGGLYQTRYPHVPDKNSGLTIGRGYDLKTKSKTEILKDFVHAGISLKDAQTFTEAQGLQGKRAKKYIEDNELENFSLTPIQQLRLFEISLAKETRDVKRIVSYERMGKIDLNKVHPVIKDVLVDLKYRGDLTQEVQELLQKHIADNNLEEFAKIIQKKDNWGKVPQDRFDKRSKYMKEQLKKYKHKSVLP